MKIDIVTCSRCSALIHDGEEKKGCSRCGRVSSTIGYERDVIIEREEISKLIGKAIKGESKLTIHLTRAVH